MAIGSECWLKVIVHSTKFGDLWHRPFAFHFMRIHDYANNISLRKVILGGIPGDRTVRVPAVHGIDPER